MNMYTRSVHLDKHISEVLRSRAKQERDFCIKKHGPRSEWKMTKEETYKVRGAECTLLTAATYFRAHVCSEDIKELLITGDRRWEATKQEMKVFLSHLPGGIRLVLDTPSPVVNKRGNRGVKNRRGRRASDCNWSDSVT